MKIEKLEVKNFRNLTNINTKFGNINILTGKNSSWKTNLIQLLRNCLYFDASENPFDITKEKILTTNILTYWKWISSCSIKTTITNNLDNNVYYWIWNEEFINCNRIIYSFNVNKDYISKFNISLSWNIWKFDRTDNWVNIKKWDNKNLIYKWSFDINNKDKKVEWNNYLSWIFIWHFSKKIISFEDSSSFPKTCSTIYQKITQSDKDKNLSEEALKRINKKESWFFWSQSFDSDIPYIYLLADIQRDKNIYDKFKRDLQYYTDWILRDVYINEDWSKGILSKWDIYIDSPHWPKNIQFISSWTAVLLYFITLKNWLNISLINKYYQKPSIMIFDELDSAIHPSLLKRFSELLSYISEHTQLFITTHSTNFIDEFGKNDVYLLKDNGSFWNKIKVKSNILSYEDIINELWEQETRDIYNNLSNSELYIYWYIDNLFPVIEKNKWQKK